MPSPRLGPRVFHRDVATGIQKYVADTNHRRNVHARFPTGLWRTRETRNDGSVLPQEGGRLGQKGICGGRLTFKGFVGSGKGTVEYKGCGDREGKGRWLTKPKNIVNGRY